MNHDVFKVATTIDVINTEFQKISYGTDPISQPYINIQISTAKTICWNNKLQPVPN